MGHFRSQCTKKWFASAVCPFCYLIGVRCLVPGLCYSLVLLHGKKCFWKLTAVPLTLTNFCVVVLTSLEQHNTIKHIKFLTFCATLPAYITESLLQIAQNRA